MKKEYGFTLIELLMVVTIIGILSALAVPMYTDNVRKTKVQEAVDTIGAIKDEIGTYVSKNGYLPPRCNNNRQIRDTIGVQVPENGKWRYRVRNNGIIIARARSPLGRTLRGGWIRCTPQIDLANRVITQWQWRSDGRRVKTSYLPR
ncbi:MAG: prepilin-type N-terminal cleavage/methylation domain-containing protein [Thermodesulfobacteriota bacterium]